MFCCMSPFSVCYDYCMTDNVDNAVGTDSLEEDVPEQKKTRSRGSSSTGLAYGGKPVDFDELKETVEKSEPVFPTWSTADSIGVARPDAPDYEDLLAVNRGLSTITHSITRVTNGLENESRRLTVMESNYRKAKALALLGVSGGTSAMREAFADLMVQEEHDAVLVQRALVEELSQRIRVLKFELDATIAVSHNLRAQLQVQ